MWPFIFMAVNPYLTQAASYVLTLTGHFFIFIFFFLGNFITELAVCSISHKLSILFYLASMCWSASALDPVRKWKRQRLRERLARSERGEELTDDSDEEFDEGFKVPGFLWKKLFKYVQYWLWISPHNHNNDLCSYPPSVNGFMNLI